MRGEHKSVSIEDVIDSIGDALEENKKSESEFACVGTQELPDDILRGGLIDISELDWEPVPWMWTSPAGFLIRDGIFDRFRRSLNFLIGDVTEESDDD